MSLEWTKLERSLLTQIEASEAIERAVLLDADRRAMSEGLMEDGHAVSVRELALLRFRPMESVDRRREGMAAVALMAAIEHLDRSWGVSKNSWPKIDEADLADEPDEAFESWLNDIDALISRTKRTSVRQGLIHRVLLGAGFLPSPHFSGIDDLDEVIEQSINIGDLPRSLAALGTALRETSRILSPANSLNRHIHVSLDLSMRRVARLAAGRVASRILGRKVISPQGRGCGQALGEGSWDSWLLDSWSQSLVTAADHRRRCVRWLEVTKRSLGQRHYIGEAFLEQPAHNATTLASFVSKTPRAVMFGIDKLVKDGHLRSYPKDARWRVWIADRLLAST
jgi:hypothetical protein